MRPLRNPVTLILMAPIKGYQKYISPGLPRRCRYYPTCSAYALDALQVHGVAKGLLLASWRVLRCNPWSRGGVDYVPEPGRWRAPQWVPPEDWAGHEIEEKPSWFSGSAPIAADQSGSRTVGGVWSVPAPIKGGGADTEASAHYKES